MTPTDLKALEVIVSIIGAVKTMPLGTLAVICAFGPDILLIVFFWLQTRDLKRIVTDNDKRFEAVVKMYESNVQLVKDYQAALQQQQKLSGDLAGIITLNTQTQTHLVDAIKNNTFCPSVRQLTGK